MLPLGPTGYGDSPYQCFSAFAGKTLILYSDAPAPFPAGDVRNEFGALAGEDVDHAALKVPEPEEGQPVEEGLPGSEKGSAMLALTPTMQGAIVTVNQALAQLGLPEWPDGDGVLTIAEFQAKHAAVIAKAVNAEAGSTGEKPVVAPPTAGAPPKPPLPPKA